MLVEQAEGRPPEDVGVETLLSVAILEGLLPVERGELQNAANGPAREEAVPATWVPMSAIGGCGFDGPLDVDVGGGPGRRASPRRPRAFVGPLPDRPRFAESAQVERWWSAPERRYAWFHLDETFMPCWVINCLS
jgi:hypothetical protein